jgi:hypothetical protein
MVKLSMIGPPHGVAERRRRALRVRFAMLYVSCPVQTQTLVATCTACQAEDLACGFEDVERLHVARDYVAGDHTPYFVLDYLNDICYGLM